MPVPICVAPPEVGIGIGIDIGLPGIAIPGIAMPGIAMPGIDMPGIDPVMVEAEAAATWTCWA